MLERRLFEEGWFVQLVGPMDFLAHELITITKAYRLSGALTIFAPLEDGTDQVQSDSRHFRTRQFFPAEAAGPERRRNRRAAHGNSI